MKSIIAILLALLLAATSFAEKNTKITEDKTTLQKQEMREAIKNADREKWIQEAISKKNIINIDNILFIGNSLISGIDAVIDNHEFIYKNGATIKYLRTKGYFEKIKNSSSNTVVICLGTNELGWFGENNFKNEFDILIEQIKNIKNNPDIIIVTIPPIAKDKSLEDEYFNNINVKVYNEYLVDIAQKHSLNVIYSNELFGDVLQDNLSYDGLHLTGEGYILWYNFIISSIENINNS